MSPERRMPPIETQKDRAHQFTELGGVDTVASIARMLHDQDVRLNWGYVEFGLVMAGMTFTWEEGGRERGVRVRTQEGSETELGVDFLSQESGWTTVTREFIQKHADEWSRVCTEERSYTTGNVYEIMAEFGIAQSRKNPQQQ